LFTVLAGRLGRSGTAVLRSLLRKKRNDDDENKDDPISVEVLVLYCID